MGVNQGASTLYSLSELDMVDVADIMKGLAKNNGTTAMDLILDVDCSNVCFVVGKSVQALASFLMKWANAGFHVVPICDGKQRPISKQATNKRRADREYNRIRSNIIRNELRILRRQLYSGGDSSEQIFEAIRLKEKEFKSAESAALNVISGDLAAELSAELERSSAHSKTSCGGFVDRVMIAEFQADALLMDRSAQKKSLIVMSTDADIPIITGDCCIAMKEFVIKKGGFKLVSTSEASLTAAKNHLSNPSKRSINKPKQPLFEGVHDRKLRAVMALILGCDVFLPGLKGVGVQKLRGIINTNYNEYLKKYPDDSLIAYLKKYLCQKLPGFDNEVVDTYIKALLCEPTNEAVQISESAEQQAAHRTYLLMEPPSTLPKYLAEFASSDTEIVDGPKVEVCSGVFGSAHDFLAADGFVTCKVCNHIVCHNCNKQIDCNNFCLQCYAQESLVPLPGENACKPVYMMRDELAEQYNFDNVDELTIDEVEDYYAIREIGNVRFNAHSTMVEYPLHASSDMDSNIHWNTVLEFSFADGGAFLAEHREELTSKSPRKQSVIQRQGINFQRREMLRRMRIDQNDRREFFICDNHKFQDEVHYVEVGHNGKRWRQGFTLTLPVDIGPKSSQIESTTSKGLGGDRTMKRILDESKAIMDRGFLRCDQFDKENDESNGNVHKKRAKKEDSHAAVERERDRYKADYVQATLALNQTFEQNAPEQHLKINPVLKRAAALDCHMTDPSLPPSDRTFFQAKLKSNPGTYDLIANSPPLVNLEIDDDEVKRRTGIVSLNAMLRYIFIVCNGDIDVMMKRYTSLTWFEEWFLHFEYKWGRTVSRAWDGRKYYGLSKRYFISVIDSKYACERRARASWPRYASYEEDMKFRKDKWNVKFQDERIVMWDMTDIRAYGFSDADSQRLTYSKYYNGNVLKGGVGAQLCGWILTGDLWSGGISDSEYNRREGHLNRQEEVANNDLVDGVVKPFTIIYDKGYRAKMIAWKTGKQRVVQPIFAKSDQRFTRDQTLHSATVATDRSGNERAVNVCKRAWFIDRGFTPNMSPTRINDSWNIWAFKANFMFDTVV